MSIKWITPVVTALSEDGSPDAAANRAIYENLITNGMDGLLILGSIGEFFAMSTEEKHAVIDNAVAAVNHRIPLLVGTNCMILKDCISLSRYALEAGADAVTIIPPYYFTLSDEAVEDFYTRIASEISGPIYLYNFPARTGYDLKPALVKKLALKFPNIVGIKDTVNTMDHTRSLIQMIKPERPDFEIYSGFDEFFAHNILAGGDGCIAGISNFAPELAHAFAEAARDADFLAVSGYQRTIDSLMDIYGIGEHFVPIIKQAMHVRGLPVTDTCKAPFPHASEAETEAIRALLKKNSLLP